MSYHCTFQATTLGIEVLKLTIDTKAHLAKAMANSQIMPFHKISTAGIQVKLRCIWNT